MRRKLTILTMVAATFGLAACSGYGNDDNANVAPGDAAAAGQGAADSAAPVVATGQTGLGEVLTDSAGLTLYGLTDDTRDQSTCDGGCAQAWPPLLVGGPEVPAGLDPALYGVIQRSDGTFQLRAGDWPLYRFAGDQAPGDTNGQGSGGVWFAVSPTGQLIGADTGDDVPADTGTEAPAEAPTEAPAEVPADTGTDDGNDDDGGYGY